MNGITRRAMLASVSRSLIAATVVKPSTRKAKPLPRVGEFFRFADPTTETPVTRLTNPTTTSLLPAAANRFVSVKERFLVFSSDRTGTAAPFRLDLRTGVLTPLAQTSNLVSLSLTLDAQERTLYFLDGEDLKEVGLTTKKVRALAEGVEAISPGNSASEFVVVRQGRLERLNAGGKPLAEEVAPWCMVRPDGKGCAFGREIGGDEREFWYAPFAETNDAKPILLGKGRISDPIWSPDGGSLLFLREVPGRGTFLSEIHEASPETGLERKVTPTSQFASFAPNGDGSVFVGASRSKAQPTVILLLRSVQREFTLCEHRASHPASVSPVFSPDSRRVYFQSDHQGKSALYSVNVELLVEPTLTSAE
jgi:oligogalacturonide lyase